MTNMEEKFEGLKPENKVEHLRQQVLDELQSQADAYLKTLDESFKGDKELCARSSAILGALIQEKFGVPLLTTQNRQITELPLEQQTYLQWRNAYHRTEGEKPERHNYLVMVIGGKKYYVDAVHSSLWSEDKKDRLIVEEIETEQELKEKYGLVPIDDYEQARQEAEEQNDKEMVYFLNAIQQDREVLQTITSRQKRLLDMVSEDLRSSTVLQTIYPREGYGPDYLMVKEKPVHLSRGNIRWIHEGVLYIFKADGQLKVFSKADAEGRDIKPDEAEKFLEQVQSSRDENIKERIKDFPPVDVLRQTAGVSFERDRASWNINWDVIGGKRYLLKADGKIKKFVKKSAPYGTHHDGLGRPTTYGIFDEKVTPEEEKEFMDKIKLLVKYNEALREFFNKLKIE